jgi:hypothetical protein
MPETALDKRGEQEQKPTSSTSTQKKIQHMKGVK